MINSEISTIVNKFIETLNPLYIYLFGSYARGDYDENSDYDFYIIVSDESYNNIEQTNAAYCSLIGLKRKPVDIIVGSETVFNRRKTMNSLENEVSKEGIIVYER